MISLNKTDRHDECSHAQCTAQREVEGMACKVCGEKIGERTFLMPDGTFKTIAHSDCLYEKQAKERK